MSASRLLAAVTVAAATLVAVGCRSEVASEAAPRRAVPVILVSIDTLRADHVGAYGGKVETPSLDALAADGILFESAWAQVPLTLPSHVSLLTGLLPAETGVRSNLGYRFDGASHPSLPTILGKRGYWTGAAVAAYVLRSESGLGPLFEAYDDEIERGDSWSVGDLQRPGGEVVAAAERLLDVAGDRPVFFLMHIFEPHTPYEPPEPFLSRYPGDPYSGEVAAADAVLASFLDDLRTRGLYDDALIIVFSDHGEGLGDHGEAEHGIFLYREAIQVPLIVKMPGSELSGTRVKTPAQLMDIVPTVAAVVGFDVPEGADGVSLVSLARGEKPDRRIFSETMYPRIHLGWSELVSLVDESWHYIDAPRPELYDVVGDPRELTNVLEDNRRVFADMREAADRYPRELTMPSDIDPEDEEKLRALGYLGGASSVGQGESLPDPKDRIGDLQILAQANESVRRERYREAIPLLEDLLSRNPGFADAWTLLGKAYEKEGRDADAIEAYRAVIRAAPALTAGTALSIAEIALRNGRPDECVEHARLALESHPGSARMLLARAALATRDWGALESSATELLADPDRRLQAKVFLAQARTGQRRFPEALAILDEAAAEAQASGRPPVPNIFLARADALALQGRVAEAEDSLRREVGYFPGNREAWIRLAVLQSLAGRDDEANRTLEGMVAANPARASYELAAQTLGRLGKAEAAALWNARARDHR